MKKPVATLPVMILAAGQNTRFQAGKPKTLLEFNGTTLLEHHISKFSRLGFQQFIVITGFYKKEVEDILPGLAETYQIKIKACHNEAYHLSNGRSVFAGHSWITSKGFPGFLLTMGDHFFSEVLLVDFVQKLATVSRDHLYLLTDRPGSHNQHIYLADVTKVNVSEKGSIRQIGKSITDYNAYDTGLFYMPISIFDQYLQAAAAGKHSISEMVQGMIETDRAKAIFTKGGFWADIDTQEDFTSLSAVKD